MGKDGSSYEGTTGNQKLTGIPLLALSGKVCDTLQLLAGSKNNLKGIGYCKTIVTFKHAMLAFA